MKDNLLIDGIIIRGALTHQRGGRHFQRVLFVLGCVDNAGYDECNDSKAQGG